MITQKTKQVYLTSMLLLAVVYLLIGFYPFKFLALSVEQHDNGAEYTPEESLHFRSPGIAQTLTAPAWLQKAIAKSDFELSLEVRTTDQEQYGPARIFTLSENPSHRNITVGQEGTNLSVRVRTQWTTLNGIPDFSINRVFAKPIWHQINILITEKTLEIRVDEDSLVIELGLTPYPLDVWDHNYHLALGNELTGDRPWRGEIRKAIVRVGDQSFDYLAPGALHIAEKFSVGTTRAANIIPFVNHQFTIASLMDWTVNFLGFVAFGWLVGMLRRPLPGIFLATFLAFALSATIETGQLLFLIDRTPSTEDLILNTLGGFVGAWIARNFNLYVDRRPIDESSK